MSDATRAIMAAALTRNMRVSAMPQPDGLCAVQCRACGWQTPRDVVAAAYLREPHGCIVCAVEAAHG